MRPLIGSPSTHMLAHTCRQMRNTRICTRSLVHNKTAYLPLPAPPAPHFAGRLRHDTYGWIGGHCAPPALLKDRLSTRLCLLPLPHALQEGSGMISVDEVEAIARRLDPDATPWKIQVGPGSQGHARTRPACTPSLSVCLCVTCMHSHCECAPALAAACALLSPCWATHQAWRACPAAGRGNTCRPTTPPFHSQPKAAGSRERALWAPSLTFAAPAAPLLAEPQATLASCRHRLLFPAAAACCRHRLQLPAAAACCRHRPLPHAAAPGYCGCLGSLPVMICESSPAAPLSTLQLLFHVSTILWESSPAAPLSTRQLLFYISTASVS